MLIRIRNKKLIQVPFVSLMHISDPNSLGRLSDALILRKWDMKMIYQPLYQAVTLGTIIVPSSSLQKIVWRAIAPPSTLTGRLRWSSLPSVVWPGHRWPPWAVLIGKPSSPRRLHMHALNEWIDLGRNLSLSFSQQKNGNSVYRDLSLDFNRGLSNQLHAVMPMSWCCNSRSML